LHQIFIAFITSEFIKPKHGDFMIVPLFKLYYIFRKVLENKLRPKNSITGLWTLCTEK
jgi:hypothetical protein